MIVTPGGIDTHIHFICPQQIEEALMSGVTTMIGGGAATAATRSRPFSPGEPDSTTTVGASLPTPAARALATWMSWSPKELTDFRSTSTSAQST